VNSGITDIKLNYVYILAAVTQILKTVEIMREEQKELKRMVSQLLTRGPSVEEPSGLPDIGISFPLSSIEDMDSLDITLKEASNATALVSMCFWLISVR